MKKKIYQKPISQDIHFKYRCPSSKCNNEHWLSLKETQTKDFKVVCECGKVFKPKRIKTVKVLYEKTIVKKSILQPQSQIVQSAQVSINADLLNQATSVMIGFGFTQEESVKMLSAYYSHSPDNNLSSLIKNTIAHHSNIGENN